MIDEKHCLSLGLLAETQPRFYTLFTWTFYFYSSLLISSQTVTSSGGKKPEKSILINEGYSGENVQLNGKLNFNTIVISSLRV